MKLDRVLTTVAVVLLTVGSTAFATLTTSSSDLSLALPGGMYVVYGGGGNTPLAFRENRNAVPTLYLRNVQLFGFSAVNDSSGTFTGAFTGSLSFEYSITSGFDFDKWTDSVWLQFDPPSEVGNTKPLFGSLSLANDSPPPLEVMDTQVLVSDSFGTITITPEIGEFGEPLYRIDSFFDVFMTLTPTTSEGPGPSLYLNGSSAERLQLELVSIPAPAGAILVLIGLGTVGWIKRRLT